jgi:hypothetical protein
MSIECNCPFCPLVTRNVNLCDVRVDFPTKHTVVTRNIPDDLVDLKDKFIVIALFFRNNLDLRSNVGEEKSIIKDNFNCSVKCIGRNKYKVCFHAS